MNPQQPYGAPPAGQYPGYGPPAGAPPVGSPPPGYPPQQQGAPYYQQPPIGSPAPGQPPYQQPPYQAYGQTQGQPPPGQYQYPAASPQPPQGQYGQPPPGQYGAQAYPPQQPPPGQQPGAYGQPPPGQPPAGYPQQAYPPQGGQPPGSAPYQQQPYPPQGQQQQYPPPGAPPGAPYQQGYPPQGQPPGAPYQQPGQYPPQPYGAPPPNQQWQQPPQQYSVPPTPASPGYDIAQKAYVAPVDTSSDVETLRKAMKGMGCDEKALIRVFTNPKYANPWAMAQLARDYNSRFIRDLAKDIESEARGDLETGLLAIMRGPLENDVRVLIKALDRAGTDEEALMDVLLCRSNADIRAIRTEYKRIKGRELSTDIKDDVEDNLYRLYSMILAATRAEDAAPVLPGDIDQKVTELQRATEGTIGANTLSVAQIFTSCNDSQIHAISEAYQRKYHRSLQDVIEKEFRGDMEDVLLAILQRGADRARFDAMRLRAPLFRSPRKDRLFINRVVSLYWDRNRLDATKLAYKKRFGVNFSKDVKEFLSGDYEDMILALAREK